MKKSYVLTALTFAVLVILAVGAAGCINQPAQTTEINVYAAASLTGAFTEIGDKFTAANPNIKVVYNFAGSQTLKTQILEGADADMYVSANDKQFDPVVEAGLITEKKVLLKNKLGIAVVKANTLKITELGDLSKSGVRLVIGDESVPFGQYTRTIIQKYENDSNAGYVNVFMNNVITQVDAVTGVKTVITTGEADASIVYVSDISKADKESITVIEIPDKYNVIASYPYGILKATTKTDAVKKFESYLTGKEGSAILTEYGFSPVSAAA
ncbi:MAG: molybdate ABC transporter substrate-binding protein [Methanocorpusculum sp.]|nr:molybdate ABC transporter substrate-binding protein [Methanocorpusculum sp.]